MGAASDWTTGPAKWVVVVVLGGATLVALGYSVGRGTTVWRGEPPARLTPTPAPTPAPASATPSPIDPVHGQPPSGPRPESPATLRGGVASESAPHAPPAIAVKIDINTAAQAELELLPGVGPALAARIIEERARGGRFTRVEDLGRVRGIGPKTIERLRAHVRVE